MDAAAIWAITGPLLGLGFMVLFRTDISAALKRLKRVKLSSSGVEGELDSLADSALRAEESVRRLPPSEVVEAEVISTTPTSEMAASPETRTLPPPLPAPEDARAAERASNDIGSKASLILLAATLERSLRDLLAATGWHRQKRMTSLPVAFDQLASELPLARTQREAVRRFWAVRSKIVHGHDVPEDAVVRAYDSGLMILSTIEAIPREINIVHHPGAAVFSDPEGTKERSGVKALMLETTTANEQTSMRVFPTTRTDYVAGKQVAWEWNTSRVWDESWYRDPDSGQVVYGWGTSAEFVGRHLDEVS